MDTLIINLNEVDKVYVGRDSGCRCGCHGTYTEYHKNPKSFDEDRDNNRVEHTIKRARRMLEKGVAKVKDSERGYINISYGNDRAITIYLTYWR